MKATELMIDDWVSYKGKMPCKIIAICKDTAVVDNDTTQDWRIDYNKLTPISLTVEILEFNEFHQISTNKYVSGKITITISGEEFLTTIKSGNARVTITVKYVHELQHVLKFCEIEKDIEL